MPVQPLPDCGSGSGGDAVDVEQTLLCDVLPNGDIVGSALAVYEYDSEGTPVGAPVFVDPVTGLPYVAQGVLQPCGDTISHAVEILCDVNEADGSAVQFERVKTIGPAGTILSTADFGLDGAPYTTLNTVQVCDPYSNCTPESNQDLGAECGPGEPVVQQTLLDDVSAPLANSVFNDDATADPLCGGTWDRPASALPPGFPVAETFRNTTFDQPGPVVTGDPADLPFLTAGAPTNDGDGAGWLRLADGRGGSNGIWQVPQAFSTSEGMNAAVTMASHDGTTPGGDGQYFVFTDGAAGTQATPIGGFGNLGLNNWTGGVFAIVLDEYGQSCTCGQALPSDPNPGPCGFCSNTISIQRAGASRVGASCACCTVASAPLAPKNINQTTRSQPLRLLTSVISEGGQTFVSASVDWNDGNGPIQYFDRVDITACITVPPTLRMGLSMNSGGAFQAIKEARDAVARPAGVSNWRAFPIALDPIPACVTLVNVSASVDVTPNDDGSQTAGNGEPELYFWLVDTASGAVLDRDQYSIIPSQLGQVQTLSVAVSVPPADVPNLRLYVGAESRDDSGEYDSTWENLTVDATGAGCPATARRTLEISARCPIPVTIVGGGGGDGGGGGTTIVNTPSTFEDVAICATVGGVPQTAFRRELRTPDGGIEVTFLGVNGLPITPDGGWTPGPCAQQTGQTLGPVCYSLGGPDLSQSGFMTLDENGDPVLYDLSGEVVPAGTYTIVVCPELTQQSHVLCDAGNAGHQFLRWYVDSPILGVSDAQWDFELDGSTPYVPVGPVEACGATDPIDREVVCWTQTSTGDEIHTGTIRHDDSLPAPGWILFDQHQIPVSPAEPGLTFVPCGGTVVTADTELVELCDDNGTFVRRLTFDATGALLSSADLTLAGAPYVPVGAVTYGCTTPDATAQIIASCEDVGSEQFTTGPNLLTNGDFEQSSGLALSSVAGPGWTTSYAPCGPNLFAAPCGASTWAFFSTNAGQVTGGNATGAQIEALGARSMAVNVGPNTAIPIIEWQNVFLENGKAYELMADAAVIIAPYDVAVKIGGPAAPGGLFPLTTPPTGNWGQTDATFVYTGATGYTSVGLYSNSGVAGGNDLAFDNFSLHTVTTEQDEVLTPVVYAGTQRAVIDQVVETTGCNDDRRDRLLGSIADASAPRPAATLDSTAQRQTNAGTVTIASGARSVTLTVLTGPVTVNLGQGVTTIPTGVTLTWSVDGPGETLAEAFAFTGVAGSDFLVISTRQ
ncbi:hypothetical protein ACH4RG_23025 [Streptomyces sp. NPDC021019]|uniref:hypothetical protein n=1 Tax=Streptomyces sp. NPDC021019 TaxID=3365108 RepID=UPI00379DA96F